MSADTLLLWSRYAGMGGLALLIFILLLPFIGVPMPPVFILRTKTIACGLILAWVMMQWTLSEHMILWVSLMLVLTGGFIVLRRWWRRP